MFGPIIDTYTRAQAFADGVLVDIDSRPVSPTETGKELREDAGINLPIAMTPALLDAIKLRPDEIAAGKNLGDRLWDAFEMYKYIARGWAERGRSCTVVEFPIETRRAPYEEVEAKAVASFDEHARPVLTLMLARED